MLQLGGSANKCGDRHAPSRLLLRREVGLAAEERDTTPTFMPPCRSPSAAGTCYSPELDRTTWWRSLASSWDCLVLDSGRKDYCLIGQYFFSFSWHTFLERSQSTMHRAPVLPNGCLLPRRRKADIPWGFMSASIARMTVSSYTLVPLCVTIGRFAVTTKMTTKHAMTDRLVCHSPAARPRTIDGRLQSHPQPYTI